MAHITERRRKNGSITYLIRVYQGIDPRTGKDLKPFTTTWEAPENKSIKTIKKELNQFVARFEEECKAGRIAANKKPYFFEYAEYVLDLKIRNGTLKHRTVKGYREKLERVLSKDLTNIGLLRLDEITPIHLNKFYMKLAENGMNKQTGGGLSKKTILEHHRVISSILAHAVSESIITENVALRASPPSVKNGRVEFFEMDEILKIINCLEGEKLKWQIITHMLLTTGIRRGEVLGLKWSVIDFDKCKIFLCNNVLYTPDRGIYEDTLKTEYNRYIDVVPEIMEMLQQHRIAQLEQRMKKGDKWIEGDFVFTQHNGRPMHPDSVTDWFNKFSKRHGLPHSYPHKFRHTAASIMINENLDLMTVSKALGHKKATTTLKIYAHAFESESYTVSNTMGKLFYRKRDRELPTTLKGRGFQ